MFIIIVYKPDLSRHIMTYKVPLQLRVFKILPFARGGWRGFDEM
jgi:hypothetical protein